MDPKEEKVKIITEVSGCLNTAEVVFVRKEAKPTISINCWATAPEGAVSGTWQGGGMVKEMQL